MPQLQATELETRNVVAIKKVLQDKRFKNRELQIMKQLVKQPHPNIVLLKQCFYSNGEKPEELYLNLVSAYRPIEHGIEHGWMDHFQGVPSCRRGSENILHLPMWLIRI